MDVTVILRKKDDPNKLHTATVYKVGHDNKPGNTAAIDNPTTAGLPNGTIWTGAYKDDEPVVTVTTEVMVGSVVLESTASKPLADRKGVSEGVPPTPNSGLMEIPPVYQFYWWDGDNSVFVPFTVTTTVFFSGSGLSARSQPC